MENVLDCAVDADKLLGLAKEKVLAIAGKHDSCGNQLY